MLALGGTMGTDLALDVMAALPLGILGYIVKPPKLEALHAKIEAALR